MRGKEKKKGELKTALADVREMFAKRGDGSFEVLVGGAMLRRALKEQL